MGTVFFAYAACEDEGENSSGSSFAAEVRAISGAIIALRNRPQPSHRPEWLVGHSGIYPKRAYMKSLD